jgi:hypothetical protein
MRKYKEEYVGRTRLTQPEGSQVVTVHFPRDIWPGRKVKVCGHLSAATAREIYSYAGRKADAEDQESETLAEVNARRSSY